MRASSSGGAEVAALLLRRGARIDRTDGFGRTALHYAVNNMNSDVVRLLVRRGASLRQKDANGEAPIDHIRATVASAGGRAFWAKWLKAADVTL